MKEINRMGVVYKQLPNGTLTCGPLDQSNKLGGTGEQQRNQQHNPTRLARIKSFHPNPKVLDYGCGSGLLVQYLRSQGIDALGYDKFGGGSDTILGLDDEYPMDLDVITMIEVVEHLEEPYIEFAAAYKMLKPGGIVMIETSFSDWMGPEFTDPYINPAIGHSTIFSHAGLDEVMAEKGFLFHGEINRNVRLYQKPDKPFDNKITLVTMGQGNPIALKRTLDSFKDHVDEVVFGDFLIFEEDRKLIESYKNDYKIRFVRCPFNWIYHEGFGETLNMLANHAINDWILYMNVSELVDGEHFIKDQISDQYNCYSFDHHQEVHRWFRLYNRKEVHWANLIHEEVVAKEGFELRPCPFNVFRMKDSEKDQCDSQSHLPMTAYAKVCNDVKEIVYWNQYLRLIEQPELRGTTNDFWIGHAREAHESYQERMAKKGKRVTAFKNGDLGMYLDDIRNNPEFEGEQFISSTLVNFQGDRKLL